MFKFNNKDARMSWHCYGVFTVNSEYISHLSLMSFSDDFEQMFGGKDLRVILDQSWPTLNQHRAGKNFEQNKKYSA